MAILTDGVIIGIVGAVLTGMAGMIFWLIKHIWHERKAMFEQERADNKEFKEKIQAEMGEFNEAVAVLNETNRNMIGWLKKLDARTSALEKK